MRRRFAPTHDLLTRMRYVPADDSAWRMDLIESECALMKDKYDPESGHAFWRYFSGATRFDLDDPQLAPYLDREAQPETWRFVRLGLTERDQISYLVRHGRDEEAWRYSFTHGVSGLDNPGNDFGHKLAAMLAQTKPGDRTEKQRSEILSLAEDYAASSVAEVGAACFRGSQDLTSQEKKASG